MSFPVFDLHCDTAYALLRGKSDSKKLKNNQCQIDLDRAAQLPGYAQCFACFTTPDISLPEGISVIGLFERELALILREIEENKKTIRLAYSAKEMKANFSRGIMSAVLTVEGPAGFDYNPDLLEDLYKIGFRITTLGWNEKNTLTGSCITGGGLTEQGRDYVKEAQRVGMVVDVSHISDEGFWDIMEITQKPIIASHSNSRAVWNVPRNLTDEMYLAICKTNGTVGINLYNDFLGEYPTLDTVCDHIIHFMQLAGSDKHVSLGGDLDGCVELPDGFTGVQDYPKLAECLLQRGLCEESVQNIFWNNALGVIEKCSM